MRSVTTIQITRSEDLQIAKLRSKLGLKSKKEVLREGLRALQETLREQKRRRRLQAASLAVRGDSRRQNRFWASRSSALKTS